jgi:hypothetical protein
MADDPEVHLPIQLTMSISLHNCRSSFLPPPCQRKQASTPKEHKNAAATSNPAQALTARESHQLVSTNQRAQPTHIWGQRPCRKKRIRHSNPGHSTRAHNVKSLKGLEAPKKCRCALSISRLNLWGAHLNMLQNTWNHSYGSKSRKKAKLCPTAFSRFRSLFSVVTRFRPPPMGNPLMGGIPSYLHRSLFPAFLACQLKC